VGHRTAKTERITEKEEREIKKELIMKSRKEKKTMKRDWLLQRMPWITATVLVTVMLLACVTLVNAAEGKPDDGWHFAITPYVWLPSISGSMKLEPPPGFESGKLNYGPGDYLENLDFAGFLDIQVQKGRWTLLADIMYTDFSDSDTAQFPGVLPRSSGWSVEADWDLQALVLEFAGAYSVFRNEYSNFNLLAGVRYAEIDGKVKIDIAGSLPAWVRSRTFSREESYFDPIIGFKGKFELGKKWYLPYYFDIGGFGVDSDLTLQAFAGIGYHFVDWFSMVLGYRYLYYDFGDDSKLVEDLNLYGATLGFNFNF
jgi:opacity protein-like surface antigen